MKTLLCKKALCNFAAIFTSQVTINAPILVSDPSSPSADSRIELFDSATANTFSCCPPPCLPLSAICITSDSVRGLVHATHQPTESRILQFNKYLQIYITI